VYPTPRPALARKKGFGKFLKLEHFTAYVFGKQVIIRWNCMAMERVNMHSKCLDFLFQGFLGGGGEDFFHFSFVPIMFPSSSQCVPQGCLMFTKFCPCISLGEKWWQRVLEREISCSQWEGSAYTHEQFKKNSFGGVAGQGLFFPWFSNCSHQVLKVFPDAFPTLFPIAPGFYAI